MANDGSLFQVLPSLVTAYPWIDVESILRSGLRGWWAYILATRSEVRAENQPPDYPNPRHTRHRRSDSARHVLAFDVNIAHTLVDTDRKVSPGLPTESNRRI
jgi:hypothetical protein